MARYIQPIYGLRVDKALAATLPAPSAATDGIAIHDPANGIDWRPRSGAGYPKAVIALFADGAASITNATLYVYGPYGIAGASKWMALKTLNAGAATPGTIALTATAGYAEEVDLPSVFDRIAVGGTVSANNAGYTATPVAEDIG